MKVSKAGTGSPIGALSLFLAQEFQIAFALSIPMVVVTLFTHQYPESPWPGYLLAAVTGVALLALFSSSLIEALGDKMPAEKLAIVQPVIERSGIKVTSVRLANKKSKKVEAKSAVNAVVREMLLSEALFKRPKPQIEGVVAHELGHLNDGNLFVLGSKIMQWAIYLAILLKGPYYLGKLTVAMDHQLAWMLVIGVVANLSAYYTMRLIECYAERRANDYASRLLGPGHTGLQDFFEDRHKRLLKEDPIARGLPRSLWILYPNADLSNQVQRMKRWRVAQLSS